MEAGKELDALVAERVFGLKLRNLTDTSCELWRAPGWIECGPCSAYSTKIAAAWQVVEKMRERNLFLDIHAYPEYYEVMVMGSDGNCMSSMLEDTVPLAICKAALIACGVEG